MSFLLDTNICSAYLKQRPGLFHRFQQHMGHMAIPSIVLAELFDWAYRYDDPQYRIELLEKTILSEAAVLDFDSPCAKCFGQLRSTLAKQGIAFNSLDLMIASVALTHDLTLVTHNTKHFMHVPHLRLVDWLQE